MGEIELSNKSEKIPAGAFVVVPRLLGAGVISEHNPPPPDEYLIYFHQKRPDEYVDNADLVILSDNATKKFFTEQNGYSFKWEAIVNKGKVILRLWFRSLDKPGAPYRRMQL